jgi:transcriptional regulator with XRE-family HTH domain
VTDDMVSRLLARARARAQLSREELALAAGTSRSAVASYESGRHSPTVRTLERLLAACDLRLLMTLEPLLASLDAKVDAMLGPVPELDTASWSRLADSLDDLGPAVDAAGRPALRRAGPVQWAVDGASALVLHGLAAPAEDLDIVVVLDEALRFWMRAVSLQGVDERERAVRDWLDADLERINGALGAPRYSSLGFVAVRVVAQVPVTVRISVPWLDRALPVATVYEVERTHPGYAEVLARWRERRPV